MENPYGIPETWLSHPDTSVLLPEERSLPIRPRDSHKGDYGKVLILGGAVGYTGAVSMCTLAAVRSGAGQVAAGVPEAIWPILAVKQDVAMPFPADRFRDVREKLDWCDVCVIGPGMGRSRERQQLVRDVLEATTVPAVVDADALFAVSRDMEVLRRTKAPLVLTPHAVEFTRMGGVLTEDRAADARRFVSEHGCTLVLKGHRTVIAFPEGEVHILAAGNPGMAKGGSGDVLAGVLGAMLGQLPRKEAVLTGACIHAVAGDLCAKELGEYGMTPMDMIGALPAVTKSMTGR